MEALPELLTNWRDVLGSAIGSAWAEQSTEDHFEALAKAAADLREAFVATGDQAQKILRNASQDTDPQLLPAYVANFVWPEHAKNFLLLWRNVLFEQHRAHILVEDGYVEEERLAELKERSREKVTEMAQELEAILENASAELENNPRGVNRSIRTWRLQKNPWRVYREQIIRIPEQCEDLVRQHKELQEMQQQLKGICEAVRDLVRLSQKEVGQLKGVARQAREAIVEEEEKGEAGRPSALASRLEQVEMQVQITPHLANYQSEAEFRLGNIKEKLSIVVKARAGMLVVHECNPSRRAEQWLESGILPLLYEIWEITESEINGVKMAIMNVHNRVALMSGEDPNRKADLSKLDLGAPIRTYQATIERSEEEFAALDRLIRRRLNLEFKLGNLFRDKPCFISGTAPSTFDQFSRNKLLRNLQEWGEERVRRVRNFIRLVEQEEALSTSEKCVRYVQNRKGDGSDSQYAGIFLTRGYIGESFCVGRDDEIAHFARLVSQWENGFRGSVCLTGKRLSGKSLFGELVAHRYFPETTIRIAPGETIRIEGRRITLGVDLEKVLGEIRKITLNQRPLIWIDDLELWQDPSVPLNQNMRALRRFLDNHSTDIFFLVSMGNWLRAYLDRFYPMDRLFQAEINLDRMSAANIREAIWVRHSATNRRLVDKEGRELNPQQVTRITRRIHRASQGVVGDALNHWSASTLPGDDNTVFNTFSDQYSLPDFITPESGMVLSWIMLQKRSQEYHLRKYFGPVFTEKYAPVIRRLLHVGILERQLDHSLEVNKLVVTELGDLLESHEYLQYRRWKS